MIAIAALAFMLITGVAKKANPVLKLVSNVAEYQKVGIEYQKK